MKIIVCGAGNVGKSIVSYLVLGNNDIIIIDNNSNKLNAISKEFDIQPILGSASHPEVLEKAGAENADMIIAVTDNDEVNMIACEIGAILFNIPKKIARINSQDFLNPLWSGLFSSKNIAVDLIISPAISIANEIKSLLKIPGMSVVTPLMKNSVYVLGCRCTKDSALKDISIRQLSNIVPQLINPFCVIHKGSSFIPSPEYKIQKGDVVYFTTPVKDADIVVREMGMEKSAVEKIIIFGGNDVSQYLASELEKNDNIQTCKIVDDNPDATHKLAKTLQNTVVIQGDMMSNAIQEEAGIDTCDATIAVLPHDKDNLLISLLAKQKNVNLSLALTNAPTYNNFMEDISDSIMIDSSAVIISGILQELRKARMRDAYSLGHNFGEIWEILLSEDNINVGQKINNIDLPATCKICAINRKDTIMFPDENTILEENDILVVYVGTKSIKKAENIFA